MDIPLLVTNPTNIRYLTGFVGVERGDAWLVMSSNKKYLITTRLYEEVAKKLDCEVIVSTNFVESIQKLGLEKLGFEENDLTVGQYNKFKNIKLIPIQNAIEKLRMMKRADEIKNIRLAANITDQCFKFIFRRIRPGMTESRLTAEIEGFFRYKGAENAFSPIVAFNEHSSQPHYQSTGKNPLRRSSLVLLDFGARVNGYCSDMTRVVFFGKPKPEWEKAYDMVLKAQQKALDLLTNGEKHGATLDAAAKEVIAEADLPPYQHSLGHNVGLDIHEGPRLSVKKDEALKPGMVFTIEPGVYIEGQYGIRIEDLVLLTDSGIEILSHSPRELTIL